VSLERSFPPDSNSVPLARRFVAELLSELPSDTIEILTLMVSELATNSVLHARSGFRLRVERFDRGVRIEVTDTGGGQAEMLSPGPLEPHGRGLHIIDKLASEWAVVRSPDGAGKTVWFSVPAPAAQAASTTQGCGED
jgi:anti-sigma regulatory factor (Ser/Thr protein kinase)